MRALPPTLSAPLRARPGDRRARRPAPVLVVLGLGRAGRSRSPATRSGPRARRRGRRARAEAVGGDAEGAARRAPPGAGPPRGGGRVGRRGRGAGRGPDPGGRRRRIAVHDDRASAVPAAAMTARRALTPRPAATPRAARRRSSSSRCSRCSSRSRSRSASSSRRARRASSRATRPRPPRSRSVAARTRATPPARPSRAGAATASSVDVDGREVTATVTPLPLVPPLADRLRASVTADAGPDAVTGLLRPRSGSAFVAPPGAEVAVVGSRAAARPPTRRHRRRSRSSARRPRRSPWAARRRSCSPPARGRRTRCSRSGAPSAPPVRAPATAAARRAAAALAARGHDATATGRLVVVALASGLEEAAAEFARAAAALDAPAVVVLAGPRDAAADALLRAQDAVLVAAAADADPRSPSSRSRARRLGAPARVVRLPPRPRRARALAAAGVAPLPPLRAAVEPDWRRSGDVRERAPPPPTAGAARGERGQASVLLVGALLAVLVGGLVARVARARGGRAGGAAAGRGPRRARRRAGDARAYPRLFEPAFVGGAPNPRHLDVAAYRAAGQRRRAGDRAAQRRARGRASRSPTRDSFAPVRIARDRRATRSWSTGAEVAVAARAEAELAPPATLGDAAAPATSTAGPLAHRQGKPMRPDVARAFDRMAARGAGGRRRAHRRRARSARTPSRRSLFARHPDPKWVAPPGQSLHRLGTELDLGPPAAYGWLARQRDAVRLRAALLAGSRGITGSRGAPARAASASARGDGQQRRCRASSRSGSRPRSAAPRSAGTSARRCSPPSSTPSRTSTRSRAARRARRGSRSSCRAPRAAYGLRNPFDADAGDRRAGPPDARPAAPVRQRPARARRLQRRPGTGRSAAAASRRTPRRAATSRGSSACSAAPATPLGGGLDGAAGAVTWPRLPSRPWRSPSPTGRSARSPRTRSCAWSSSGSSREDERVELLHGVLTEKAVKGPAHEALKTRLMRWLAAGLARRSVLRPGRGRVHRARPDLVSRAGHRRHRARPTRSSTRRRRCSSSRWP